MKKIVSVVALMIFIALAVNVKANGEVSNCMTLAGNNTNYHLIQNVSMSGCEEGGQLCLIVNGYNITLDCQGFWINSNNYCLNAVWNRNGDGYTGGENLTIKNCGFVGWQGYGGEGGYGVYTDYNNTLVENCTFIANFYSVRFNSINSILRNSNIINGSWYSSSRIYVGNNYPQEQQNLYYSNNISSFPYVIPDVLNYWNTTSGNWWVGYSENCTNQNNDTFCDIPYNLTLSNNNTDYKPLTNYNFTEEIPEERGLLYTVLADTGSGLGGFFEAITSSLAYLILVFAMISSIFTIFYVVAAIIKKSLG